jgi:FG-GAP repeat
MKKIILQYHRQSNGVQLALPALCVACVLAFCPVNPAGAQPVPASLLSPEAQLNVAPGLQELEGNQLAISGDTLVLGDLADQNVQVYVQSGTNWQYQATLTNANFAGALSLPVAIDGDTILAAPPTHSGAVDVFVRTGTNWAQQATLTSTDEFFGDDVCISGDTAAIGASAAGSVQIFVRTGTHWTRQARIVTNGRDKEGGVALDGDTLAIADDSYDHGATFIFTRTGTNWTEQARVSAVDGANFAVIRRTVAVNGDTLAVGDPCADFSVPDRAYVFVRDGTNWSFQAKLVGATSGLGADFGRRLALQRDTLVVGADNDSQAASFAGAVYVFGRSGTNWSQLRKLFATNPTSYQLFGSYLGMAGNLVGVWGQTAPAYVFAPAYLSTALKLLYYQDADNSPGYEKDLAAFRYKDLLYGLDTNGIRPQFELITNFYGPPERARAQEAEDLVIQGLQAQPTEEDLQNTLLDIYYDRTVAETLYTRNLQVQAAAAHYPTVLSGQPAPASGFVIDNEIPLYEQTLATNRYALETYFSLFTNGLGIADSPPLGYQIFTNLEPTRGLMPATYLDTNGVPQPVTTNGTELFSGYKDLTLLFDQLHDYGNTATTLGKLLVARAGSGDSAEASNVVSQAQQFLFLDGAFLRGMFATLPGTNDPSGLAQSIQGWSDSLTALTTLSQNLVGGANLLGFSPDFLMYVYALPNENPGTFNSYDALRDYLDPNNANNGSHPISVAVGALQGAETSYGAYRGYQDQLADQLANLNQGYSNRLRDIVGAFPGDPLYGDNPTNNPGSLLDQQYEIIQQARLKILENQTAVSNLYESVRIEEIRAGAVSNAYINFGNTNASIDETIGHIQAAQAAANGVASTLGNLAQTGEEEGPVGAGISGTVGIANAVWQGVAEEWKGQLQADKDRNSALEQAQITGLNSAAAVKTMMLQMSTLLIQSEEAALQLQQAADQLSGLYREKQQLEQRIAQQSAGLASRYYADPVHRLVAQADMVSADTTFNYAQLWLFFMERALAYKWNTPLNHTYNGITWTEASLFKLRNASELTNMFNAMNDWDSLLDATLAATQTNVDYFSVRDDFFGYVPTNDLGQAVMYPDPISGQSVDATQAFRDRLRTIENASDPNNSYIDLTFSTVRQIPGKAFFEGPVFASDGTLISRGLCLDKIEWIKINLPGPHTFGGSYLQGTLSYGGTSFIRDLLVGTYDPTRPDRLLNEMTAYSTRRWYYSPVEDTFTSEEAQTNSVSMQLSTQAGVVPSSTEIDVFNERSVATSGWNLTIPLTVAGTPVLLIDQLDDIEIWFKHIATDRITQ